MLAAAENHPDHRRRQQRSAEPRPASPGGQYDRDTAARFGISPQLIDNTLYDAFGQRQVSTMYTVAEPVSRGDGSRARSSGRIPRPCARSMCARPNGQQVPLSAFAHYGPAMAPLVGEPSGPVPGGHHFLQPAARRRAGRCRRCHRRCRRSKIGLPPTIQTVFAGTAQAYQDSLGSEPLPDRRGAGGGLHRARHPLRKLHPSRSRFFPRCPRPAWARCWRSCSPTPISASSP